MSALSDSLRPAHGPAWRNRLALAPLTNTQSNDDGTLSDDELDWLVARGRGGFGLTVTCAAYVSPEGRAWRGQLGIASDDHLPGLTRLAAGLRATGTRSAVQLHHAGMRADAGLNGTANVAPWDEPRKDAVALTTEGVDRVVTDFVDAAVRAEQAGFDGVQVHGAHGYLLGQFLDGRSNHRADGYGGPLEHRMRALLEVVTGIRAATGPDFQLGLRLSPEGYGITVAEGRETARTLLATGVLDYLDISLWDVRMRPRDTSYDGLLIDHFTDLPRHGALLSVAGKVTSAADARWCLDKGADVVSVGIGAILHHDFAARAIADPGFEVRARPVPAEVLAAEHVGPAFVDYLAAGWDDLVA
ncbi:2,4-dienoyl-CoA reductase-like NADH-dependent reductase (Old Yellow Enzyme family) [Nocardioides sp. J9]|uniref:NADH:flavin oxidoreductase n=1 Tax=Nocardioides sp. J9 TaxID=935844 RepID=UPI0011AAD98B|nr:NADH:flavin oxidoreductase [Nocardioides sp. J9]TWG91564.1 2,4-dienoyl-CoA reductase-like NADH-dependent reductase (Old Yellow Enzyme family) [Nocardioides sp. J9]